MTPNMVSPFIVSLLILLPLSLLVQCVSSGPNGFSIKLIHRDSIDSPLYPGNLSSEERLSRYHDRSLARLKHIALSYAVAENKTVDPDTIQPPIIFNGEFHLALVGIGTFGNANKPYYLLLDTGSSFTWTQCVGSDPQFIQTEPLYPYKNSATYQQVPCQQDSDCFDPRYQNRCVEGSCNYTMKYADKSYISGKYAREKLTFHSDNGATETVDNFLFGCGFNQTDFEFEDPAIAGILGLGTGEFSLLHQLGERAQNRFSFCLQLDHDGSMRDFSTFLRFGDEAKFKEGQVPKVTQLTDFRDHLHLHLHDISVEGVPLNFPPGTFEVKQSSMKGGFVIDTGSSLTMMQEAQYKVVKDAMVKHFSKFPELHRVPYGKMDLCYSVAGLDFNSYPKMTLHFINGADYEVAPTELFSLNPPGVFCLTMKPFPEDFDDVSVLLGNFMLTNRRFVFDLDMGEMSFVREVCVQE